MRVLIGTVQVPYLRGGAELLAERLEEAVRRAGHSVDTVTMPFRFGPASAVARAMGLWEQEDLSEMHGGSVDRLVCLKFPAYYASHPRKRVWLLHQHRSAYELQPRDDDQRLLARDIRERDRKSLAAAERVFTISKRVSARLWHYNQILSSPIYHPPPLAGQHRTAASEPFVLFVSRLETHKRPQLFVEAVARARSEVKGVIVGDGGQRQGMESSIAKLGIEDRVVMLGEVSDRRLVGLFSRCLAVCFPTHDEDYGYVTLEAMASGKPVISCTDSGAPLEFLEDGVSGRIVPPEAEALAEAIDELAAAPAAARRMGRAGADQYESLGLSWDRVVECLLS